MKKAPHKKTIVVAGDTTIDWFMYPAKSDAGQQEPPRQNWRLNSALRAAALPGGAYMFGEFIRGACDALGVNARVDAPKVPEKLTVRPPEEVIHSNATLGLFRIKGDPAGNETVLRVRESFGYIGPVDASVRSDAPERNPATADIVVLDDAGNGFRDKPKARQAWANAIQKKSQPVIIHKMSRPLGQGALWDFLRENHWRRHVLIVNASDIRQTDGVQISRALSWERTAKDFVFQMGRSAELQKLRHCRCLIVLFDTDGAIIHFGGEADADTIVYDPRALEGGYAATIEGTMNGLTTVFTASVVAQFVASDCVLEQLAGGNDPAKQKPVSSQASEAIVCAVRRALHHTRQMVKRGFAYKALASGSASPPGRGTRTEAGIEYRCDKEFWLGPEKDEFSSCTIDRPRDLREADPKCWTILDHKTANARLLAAEEVVCEGFKRASRMKGTPLGEFGALQTVDRMEIESFAAIRELIREYRANEKPERPLCLAVFGPPGSGKSFSVNQVAMNVGVKETEMLKFNVSQFRGYDDLVAALHLVRNIALKGNLPFVFFDEFDTPLGAERLGWLKYFLAPMQDGEFRDHGADHPIGKAVFVFAGGTRSCFDNFMRNAAEANGDDRQPESPAESAEQFRQAKGPDFVSRLQGHIDIMGPNRADGCDHAFLIRRAMLLRSMLKIHSLGRKLFDGQDRLQIDPGVLRALLCVSEYRHGSRSMTAIFDMCSFAGQQRFTLSTLPSKQLLNAHVDGEEFLMLAQKERYQSLLCAWNANPLSAELAGRAAGRPLGFAHRESLIVEAVAELIHDAYCAYCEKTGEGTSASKLAHKDLPPDHKQSNRDAAEDVPAKLRGQRYGLRLPPDGIAPRLNRFPPEVVEELAKQEHQRWMLEKRMQGFRLGEKKNPDEKTHPDLKAFQDLDKKTQGKDRSAVEAIPEILWRLGYEIYSMDTENKAPGPANGKC